MQETFGYYRFSQPDVAVAISPGYGLIPSEQLKAEVLLQWDTAIVGCGC